MWPFHLNKHKSSIPTDAFCQVWLKLAQWFYSRRFFNFCQCIFTISLLSPLKKRRSTSFKKLESPSPKGDLCLVWLKLAQWFWRRRLFQFVKVFLQFHNYLPLEKNGPFIWTNYNPLHPRMLCQVSLKLPVGSEKNFLKFVNAYSHFHNNLPL